MKQQGYAEEDLPCLDGAGWKSWFARWRKRFQVVSRKVSRKTVKHLKVSPAKLRQRVRVYLKNVFSLRFLWKKCFGEDRPMRWVSWDQKPAWFNNTAGDTTYAPAGYKPQMREIHAHGRQRFTICTCVDFAATGDSDAPPPAAFHHLHYCLAPTRRIPRHSPMDAFADHV